MSLAQDSATAMQGLYQHVKSVYRSVKDASAKVEPPASAPMESNTPRGRAVVALNEKRPWGYHSPARQPSPSRKESPKTLPRTLTNSPGIAPETKPALPLAPKATAIGKRLLFSPPPRTSKSASPEPRTRDTATRVADERLKLLEQKIEELSTVLTAERHHREQLEAEVAVLKAQHDFTLEMRKQVDEQREFSMSLGSQVQFALAWIQQVDRHIAQDEDRDYSSLRSSPSASRHLDDNSTHRLPPSQPVPLVRQ